MRKLTHHLTLTSIYSLAIPIIVLYSLALVGCITNASPWISSIYLLKLQSQKESHIQPFEVRIGYFGICVGTGGNLECAPSSGKSAQTFMSTLSDSGRVFPGVSIDEVSTSLIEIGIVLQSKILLYLLAAAGPIFLIGLFVNLLEALNLVKKNNGIAKTSSNKSADQLKVTSNAINWIATALALAASVGIVQATAAIQYITTTVSAPIVITSGSASQGMHWTIVILSLVFTLGRIILLSRAVTSEGSSLIKPSGIASRPTVKIGGTNTVGRATEI